MNWICPRIPHPLFRCTIKAVAILARQGIRLDAKAIYTDTAWRAPGCHQSLKKRQVFLQQRIFFRERASLCGEVAVGRQLDLQLPFGRRDLAAQAGVLILQVRIEILEPRFFALRLALIEARILAAEIVGQPGNAECQPRDDNDRKPTPVPWDVGVNRDRARQCRSGADGSYERHGSKATCSIPVASGKPNIRVMFCTA